MTDTDDALPFFATHAGQGILFGTAKRKGRVRLDDGTVGNLIWMHPLTRVCKIKVWTRHLRVPASRIVEVLETPPDEIG